MNGGMFFPEDKLLIINNVIETTAIIQIIKDLNPNKSSDISPRILKLFTHIIAPLLTTLFNNCLRLGIFPDELKIARIIPLYKSGDKSDITNYRPISLLPVLSKIFEKLIHSRMTNFFDENNVILYILYIIHNKHFIHMILSQGIGCEILFQNNCKQ